MTEYTRVTDKFYYHTEDLNCSDCLHRIPKSQRINKDTGCGEEACRFEDIRHEAAANGRIKRPKGWFTWHG